MRDGAAQRLEVTGTVVGAFPFARYEEKSLELRRGIFWWRLPTASLSRRMSTASLRRRAAGRPVAAVWAARIKRNHYAHLETHIEQGPVIGVFEPT